MLDFGTGGLDLAYEVMRGYDALVLVDISRQGEPPGTLYVMEPDPADVDGGIEDGAVIDPHAMDPQTVLRFVKAVGGWPGKVVIVACEPASVGEMDWGLSKPVEDAVDRAVAVVLEQVAGAGHGRRLREGALAVHELSIASAVVNTAVEARRRAARGGGDHDHRRAAPGGARLAGVLLRDRGARHGVRGRAAGAAAGGGAAALRGCGQEWEPEVPAFRCPACGSARVEMLAGDELEVESIEVEEEEACIAPR